MLRTSMMIGAALVGVGLTGQARAQSAPPVYTYAAAYASVGNNQVLEGDFYSSETARQQTVVQSDDVWRASTTSSYSNLRTGSLGISANASDFGAAVGWAEYGDVLTFSVAGADADTITRIDFTTSVHGRFYLDPLAGTAQEISSAGYQVAFSNIFRPDLNNYFTVGAQVGIGARDNRWSDWSNTMEGAFVTGVDRTTFSGHFLVKGASSQIGMMNRLSVNAYSGAFGGFGNTATLRFSLPDTVTMQSQSGVFLSDVGGVPEPSAWALLIVGFGAVGGALRRSRKDRQALIYT